MQQTIASPTCESPNDAATGVMSDRSPVAPSLSYATMQQVLMDELRLMHYPVAVKFFFDEAEVEAFRARAEEFFMPARPVTFCQWEIAARMQGQTVLGEKTHLGCTNAAYVFGWRSWSQAEVKSHAKYTCNLEQAERFLASKPRLPEGELQAIAVSPLGSACVPPDTVHFYVDNMQAYHLAVDYMAAMDIHPLQSNITMNSSACGGNVHTYQSQSFNMLPACSGSYNAGKTERGEVNVIIPGNHISQVVERLLERKGKAGAASITRPGDPFPGADVCKNCPLISYKPGQVSG
jgi:uncharacterized protein (DUF169 family)